MKSKEKIKELKDKREKLENDLLNKHQFILYTLAQAMRPRMFMTVNEKLETILVQLIVE